MKFESEKNREYKGSTFLEELDAMKTNYKLDDYEKHQQKMIYFIYFKSKNQNTYHFGVDFGIHQKKYLK